MENSEWFMAERKDDGPVVSLLPTRRLARGRHIRQLHLLVTSRFPKEEVYGLASQLRRAAVSVSSNLAEGSGRASKAEFARYVEIAYGSLMESVSQLCISQAQGWITGEEFETCSDHAQQIARMLSGLKRSLTPPPP